MEVFQYLTRYRQKYDKKLVFIQVQYISAWKTSQAIENCFDIKTERSMWSGKCSWKHWYSDLVSYHIMKTTSKRSEFTSS